jgi:hypothetical protein
VEFTSQAGATLKKLDDLSLLASGTNGKDTYTLQLPTQLSGITAIRVEALLDESLPAKGPGRAKNGNFVVSELRATIAPQQDPAKVSSVTFRNALADFSQDGYGVSGAIDGNDATGWAIMPAVGKAHEAVFETAEDLGSEGGSILTLALVQQYQDGMHTLGRFRVSATTSPRPVRLQNLPADVAEALAVAAGQRSAEQAAKLAAHYQSLDTEYQRLKSSLARAEQQLQRKRLIGVQDLAWALINSSGFLFNR